eukprot:6209837-Pleurochrysis_carterae.AAC.2
MSDAAWDTCERLHWFSAHASLFRLALSGMICLLAYPYFHSAFPGPKWACPWEMSRISITIRMKMKLKCSNVDYYGYACDDYYE